MDRPFLEARDLVREFGGLRAVDGMSLTLAPGEMVGLIGPNGAGKTTLFNLLAGSLRPTSGSIRIAGADVSREGPERRIARGVGRTFQIPRPFAEMTVLENVLTGAQGQAGERAWTELPRAGPGRRRGARGGGARPRAPRLRDAGSPRGTSPPASSPAGSASCSNSPAY